MGSRSAIVTNVPLVVALALAGCVSTPIDEGDAKVGGDPASDVLEIRFVEHDGGARYSIDPAKLAARVGGDVTLRIVNPANNTRAHDLQIDGLGVYIPHVRPGQSRVATFQVTTAGNFMYWCTLDDGDHHAKGMMGLLCGGS